MTYPSPPPEGYPYAGPGAPQPGAVPSYQAARDVPPYGPVPAGQHRHQYQAGYGMPGPGYPGVRGATDPDDMTLPLYSASFGAAVKRFFKGYVRFRGRASRSEYWWVQLFGALVGLAVGIVMAAVMVPELAAMPASEVERLSGDQAAIMEWIFDTSSVAGVFVAVGLLSLFLLLPQLALGWRRLQDANVPGGWTFMTLAFQASSYIPLLGSLAGLGGFAWWIVVGTLSTKPEGQRFDRL